MKNIQIMKYGMPQKIPVSRVNDALDSHDANPSASDVSLTKDGAVVTPTVSISIKDSAGNNIANITTSDPDEYTITYNISYNKYSSTLTRKVIVKEE